MKDSPSPGWINVLQWPIHFHWKFVLIVFWKFVIKYFGYFVWDDGYAYRHAPTSYVFKKKNLNNV